MKTKLMMNTTEHTSWKAQPHSVEMRRGKLKGSLHPFALSFVSLETQSYFLMVMVYSLIFP